MQDSETGQQTAVGSEPAYAVDENCRTYIDCGSCGAAYRITEDAIGIPGRRVECAVCQKVWFQSGERIKTLRGEFCSLRLLLTSLR